MTASKGFLGVWHTISVALAIKAFTFKPTIVSPISISRQPIVKQVEWCPTTVTCVHKYGSVYAHEEARVHKHIKFLSWHLRTVF